MKMEAEWGVGPDIGRMEGKPAKFREYTGLSGAILQKK